MKHLLAFNHCHALLLRLNDSFLRKSLDRRDQIISYFESVKNSWFLWIWSIKAEMGLGQPLWKMDGDRIAILALQDNVVILGIVEQCEALVDDWVRLKHWLHRAACFLWQIQDHLFFTVQS